MSENKQSVDCRRLKDRQDAYQPGDFCWEFDFTHFEHGAKPEDQRLTIYICLPGNTRWHPLHVARGGTPTDSHTWGWDGNFDKPTLTPSIHEPGTWHGHLQAGRLISCP